MSLSKAPHRILPSLSLKQLRAPTTSNPPINTIHLPRISPLSTTTRTHRKPHKLQPRPETRLQNQRRAFTTSHLRHAAKAEAAEISIEQYHKISDQYIDELVAGLEEMQEEREDVDVEYSAGVLTLLFPPHGTYVLNKQPPNKQIWLSSPVSGPKRYDWVVHGEDDGKEKGEWVYLRDGSTLSGLLEEEVGVVPGEGEES